MPISIWERTATALGNLSPAVPYAGNVYPTNTGTPLPDTFIVYFLVTSPPEQHADDAEVHRSYTMQVSVFSRAGLVGLPDVDTVMVAAGFRRAGWRELAYDRVTRHFGVAKDFVFVE